MNIVQLEKDLRTATAKAEALIMSNGRTAEDQGRAHTDDEVAAIRAALAEAEAIQLRIDGAKDDAGLLARLDKLTGGRPTASASGLVAPRSSLSIGTQFVQSEEYRALIKAGFRRGSQWSSGAIECFDPFLMRATTLTEDPASGGKLLIPQYQPGILSLQFKKLT